MSIKEKNTLFIRGTAQSLGFDYCGIAKAQQLDDDARRLESWLNKGFQGSMSYMNNYFDLRIDPSKLVPGAKSVITLLLNYYPSEKQNSSAPQVSKYAYGKDYHEVIKEKLKTFLQLIKENIGDVHGRGFTDSAPVLERRWAQKSGLGWIGKNGNLITKNNGSFFFIATLITDLDLEADDPFAKDYCGSCTKCIDNCPTDAILPDKVIDGSKCISYFTIELKDLLMPDDMKGKFENKASQNSSLIIDMYATARQQYLGSFYIPKKTGNPKTEFLITDNTLFAIIGNELIRYRFAQNIIQHFISGEAENLNKE